MGRPLNILHRLKRKRKDRQYARLEAATAALWKDDFEGANNMFYGFSIAAKLQWPHPIPEACKNISFKSDGSFSLPIKNLSSELVKEWFDAVAELHVKPLDLNEYVFAALCDPKYRIEMVDDRREIYRADAKKFGEMKAELLYMADTIRAMKGLIGRLAIGGALIEASRRAWHWFNP